MMSVFFEKKFVQQRLDQTGNTSQYVDVTNDGECNMRPADNHTAKLNGLQFGELWILYTKSNEDIQTTDRLIIDDEKYKVKGVKRESFNSIDFLRVLLIKQKV